MNHDAIPAMVPIPEVRSAPLSFQLRFWLIRKLANRDLVYMNTETVIPEGWALCTTHFDQGVFVANNAFRTDEPTLMPTSIVFTRPYTEVDEEDEYGW